MDLDAADRTILIALREDARRSFRELARLSGVSTPTAAAKVRRLEALGIVEGYAARIDPRALGRTLHLVELHATPAEAPDLAAAVGAMPHVEEVLEMAGGLLHARLAVPSGAPLHAFLQALSALEGLQSYRLHPIMGSTRAPPAAADTPREVHIACHECKDAIHGPGVHKRWDEDGSQDHWFCCRNCAATFETRLRARAQAARAPKQAEPGRSLARKETTKKRTAGGRRPSGRTRGDA